MFYKMICIATMLIVSGCGKKTVAVQESTVTTQNGTTQVLRAMNDVRKKIFNQPIRWNNHLATSSAQYANYLAKNGLFEHGKSVYGENLFISSRQSSYLDAIKTWESEAKNYNYQSKRCNVGAVCGHYTQLIWKKTTEVGCGKATIQKGKFKGGTIILCRFNPRGNIHGYSAY